jgi:hypothetical protein
VDTGLGGHCLCLIGGDVADGGVDPLTIVIAFDVGKQVAPSGIPIELDLVKPAGSVRCRFYALGKFGLDPTRSDMPWPQQLVVARSENTICIKLNLSIYTP